MIVGISLEGTMSEPKENSQLEPATDGSERSCQIARRIVAGTVGLGFMRGYHTTESRRQPINMGQDRTVTINQLAQIVAETAGVKITPKHIDGYIGVRGSDSHNILLGEVLQR
jgi:hypothetical protein